MPLDEPGGPLRRLDHMLVLPEAALGDQEATTLPFELKEAHLQHFVVALQDAEAASPETVIALLFELRLMLLKHGSRAQEQVCASPLYASLLGLLTSPQPKLVEAACHVLCTLIARNSYTSAVVCGTPGVLVILFHLLGMSAGHVFGGGCVTCGTATPPLDASVRSFSFITCPVTAPACGAMWALCALCMNSPEFQASLAHNTAVVASVIAHQSSACEEAVTSSAWLLCNMGMGAPALAPVLMEAGVAAPLLLTLTHGPMPAKGLAARTVRALVLDNNAIQCAFDALGAVPILTAALHSPLLTHDVQASLLWALGALCHGVPTIQHRMRCGDSGAALVTVVSLLTSESPQVQMQAAATLYNSIAGCRENQSFVGAIPCALESLAAMLPATQSNAQAAEKALAALVCLTQKHAANQARVDAVPGCVAQIVHFLTFPSSRVQGLAAGAIRSLVAEQVEVRTRCIALGALPLLLDLCASKDAFAQEQSVAALFNCMKGVPGGVPVSGAHAKLFLPLKPELPLVALPLEPELPLVALLCDGVNPTLPAYTCAVRVLGVLCVGDTKFAARLGHLHDALVRLRDSGNDARLQRDAELLLQHIRGPRARAGVVARK